MAGSKGAGPMNGRSRRSNGQNDEEEFLWEALQRLPTYTRLRTAILKGSLTATDGENDSNDNNRRTEIVDVDKLGKLERRLLVERAFATTEQDNGRLLRRVKERLDRVDYDVPSVEVRFQNLSVTADVYAGARALPTLVNYVRNMIEGSLTALRILPSQKYDFSVLTDVSGFVKPGRMALLLGPPGSGKSTLLLALAGKLDSSLRTSGEITYDGHKFAEFFSRRTSAYISQTDNHIGDLTVRETLDFAARCQGVGCKYAESKELSNREKEMNIRPDPDIDAFMKAIAVEGEKHSLSTDYILKVLGLEICAETKVGSEMVRGVSGGQKKRVTTGEMVVGPRKVLFMDEISTGLDSSTAYQIVRCIRNFVHFLDGTVLMALLQPAPETFELFDDIILLSEGHIIYQGPRERVLEFFDSLGFVLPPRKGIADFLQEVTSRKDQAQYWAEKTKPYEFVSISKMVEAFSQSEFGRNITAYLAVPNDKSQSHPLALAQTKYALSRWAVLKACAQREMLLISRHWFLYTFRTCQVCIVATITCTLFIRTRLHPTDESSGNLYLGSLFFGLVHMMFNGFSELAILIERLPVFYKQRDSNFYPAWAFSITSWILRIPYSIIEAIIWSSVVYYTVGFSPEVGRFFRYMLLLFLIHQMALGLFRLIGAVGRNMIVANTFGSFALMVVFLLGGFILSKDNIKSWWVWAFWISPLSYSQNAVSVNEFLAPRWNKKSQYGNATLANNILESHGLFTSGRWYWIGIGVLFGYACFFNFLVTVALRYLHPLGKPQAMIPEDALKEKVVCRHGEKPSDGFSHGDLEKGETAWHQAHGQSVSNVVRSMETSGENPPRKGMILPFQPLSMTFHNVNYYVDMPRAMNNQGIEDNRLKLLCNVSGAFQPKQLTALVGVSGAGKTTLMDVLAGRKTGGYIEGDIRISGHPKAQDTFARVSGYVEQTDIHSPQLTVEESLVYSSWLRLSREVDKQTREAFVNEVMSLVELDSLRHALVGLAGSTGLSTEQRKRLTIAVELVANPSIIFMDEPTSGLDARAAAIVMRTVRNTVDTGRTVVCTIHQPSIDIFEAFDELLLMKRGGQVIYAGSLGQNSQLMINYFEAIPGVPAIQDGYNPATWMLEISTQAAEQRIGQDFAAIYESSDLYRKNEALIQQLSIPTPGLKPLNFTTQYAQSICTQFVACYWKQNLTYWRSPHYNVVRIFFTTICALIFGSVFWDLGSKRETVQDLFNVMGALYSSVLFLGINNAASIQPVVFIERTVYYREKATGMYASFPYAFAQGLVEIPYIAVQTLIYGCITYFMINFELATGKFFLYLIFMFLTLTYFAFYGMMAVGITSSQQLAAVVSSAFYSIWNLLSGFLIPKPKIPGWWIWFYYICPVAWTLRGLISSQLGDVESQLNGATFNGSVREFLESYLGYKQGFIGVCLAVLIGFSTLFFCVFAISIHVLNFQRR